MSPCLSITASVRWCCFIHVKLKTVLFAGNPFHPLQIRCSKRSGDTFQFHMYMSFREEMIFFTFFLERPLITYRLLSWLKVKDLRNIDKRPDVHETSAMGIAWNYLKKKWCFFQEIKEESVNSLYRWCVYVNQ